MTPELIAGLVAVGLILAGRSGILQAPGSKGISSRGLTMLKGLEGFSAVKYWDYKDYSIGYGHLIDSSAGEYQPEPMSLAYASALLDADLARDYCPLVEEYVNVPLATHQRDALIILVYNLGEGYFSSSTVVKRINDGASADSIKEAWAWWNKAGGVVNPGLVARRNKEINLYLHGIYTS